MTHYESTYDEDIYKYKYINVCVVKIGKNYAKILHRQVFLLSYYDINLANKTK